MRTTYRFSFAAQWHTTPMAYWVHLPVAGALDRFDPPAPKLVPHHGYPLLWVCFVGHELVFSAPAQLAHFIEVLARKPLPTSRQLSALRGPNVGPNGHWLSRLPAALKAPRARTRLVKDLSALQTQLSGDWAQLALQLTDWHPC